MFKNKTGLMAIFLSFIFSCVLYFAFAHYQQEKYKKDFYLLTETVFSKIKNSFANTDKQIKTISLLVKHKIDVNKYLKDPLFVNSSLVSGGWILINNELMHFGHVNNNIESLESKVKEKLDHFKKNSQDGSGIYIISVNNEKHLLLNNNIVDENKVIIGQSLLDIDFLSAMQTFGSDSVLNNYDSVAISIIDKTDNDRLAYGENFTTSKYIKSFDLKFSNKLYSFVFHSKGKSYSLELLFPIFISVLVFILLMLIYSRFLKMYTKSKQESQIAAEVFMQIEKLSWYDPISGLPNRQKAMSTIDEWGLSKTKFAIVLINLKNFKSISDSIGVASATNIIREYASELRLSIGSDNDYVLASMGGAEFALLVDLSQDELLFNKKITQLESLSEKVFPYENHTIKLPINVGVSFFPENGSDSDALINCANLALNFSSKTKKGFILNIYNKSIGDIFKRHNDIKQELPSAILKKEFEMVYQPKFKKSKSAGLDFELAGIEALIRWNNSVLGNVPPAEFIPIAEESVVIYDIGLFALENTFKLIKYWQSKGRGLIPVSVNLSPNQLMFDSLIPDIVRLLKQYQVLPQYVKFEVTESNFQIGVEGGSQLLEQLGKMGFGISIDDFGTGYSNFSHLKDLDVDELKIDASFVKNITEDNSDPHSLISTIINIAHKLSLTTVAEGVETITQVNSLLELGCDELQGYYFSKPLSFNDLEKKLFPSE